MFSTVKYSRTCSSLVNGSPLSNPVASWISARVRVYVILPLGRLALLLLHAGHRLIGGRVVRLLPKSLPGLDDAGGLRAGGDLRRGVPAKSEHPPGARSSF